MNDLAAKANKLVYSQTISPIGREEFDDQYKALIEQYNELEKNYTDCEKEITRKHRESKEFTEFIKSIRQRKILEEFDDKLFRAMVKRMDVYDKGKRIIFHLKNGKSVEKTR